MSRERCPDCNSSDGLAEYGDGTYCYSCKTNRKNKSLLGCADKRASQTNDLIGELSHRLPQEAHEFLEKYDITSSIIHLPCKLSYSEYYDRICFEYQGSYALRSLDKQPKWLYKGKKKSDINFLFLNCADNRSGDLKFYMTKNLVLVEDILSAIKVQQVSDCICLNGTVLTDENKAWLIKYGKDYEKIVLFLDGDKAGKISKEKLRKELKLLYTVVIVRNLKDPKSYDLNTLKEILK